VKHYPYGGSTAKRTTHCTPWRNLSAGIPNTESAAAARGTAIHYMLEQKALVDDYQFESRLGSKVEGVMMTHEDIALAVEMWDATTGLMAEYQIDEYEAETTGEFNHLIGSTVDFVGRGFDGDTPVVILADYKTGRGVQVGATGNEQLLHNAMCLQAGSEASDLFDDVDHFIGVILQPDRSGNLHVKKWGFTREMVHDFQKKFVKAVAKAEAGEGKPVAGSHCAFCPAEATCPAKTGQALEALRREPANLEILASNMDMVDDLRAWCSRVEKAAFEQLELGAEVDGFKLVRKLARESWVDQETAIKLLRRRAGGKKELVEEKLKSPAQVRKLIKALGHDVDLIELGLTKKESSGTTIAPESDKREAVMSTEALSAALASVS